MVDDVVVVRSDRCEAGLGLEELNCELERVVAYLSCLHTHVAVLLDCHAYLTIPIARRELAGRGLARGYQADGYACPGKAVLMRLADAGLSMKAISSTATDSGDGFRG